MKQIDPGTGKGYYLFMEENARWHGRTMEQTSYQGYRY